MVLKVRVSCFFFFVFSHHTDSALQERCRVVVAVCQENESCTKVLNFLERLDDRIR